MPDDALAVHLGGRSPRFMEPDKFLADLPMSKLAMAEPIGILLFGGVFQKFPKLKFGTIESGVGWFAWYAAYAEASWKNQRYWTNSPLTELPSFYMDRNVYGSFIDEPVGIRNIDMPGAGNIMWSSDYPHSKTTYPPSLQVIDRIFEGVSDDVKERAAGSITRKFYRTGDGRVRQPESIAAE